MMRRGRILPSRSLRAILDVSRPHYVIVMGLESCSRPHAKPEALFLSQMYSPSGWSTFANSTYPQLVQAVAQEASNNSSLVPRDPAPVPVKKAPGLGRRVTPFVRRADPSGVSYTSTAIWCGDSIDRPSTTMLDVFNGIITRSRNVSRMCTSVVNYSAMWGLLYMNCIDGGLWPAAIYECPFWPVRSVERYRGPFNKTLANRIIVATNLVRSSLWGGRFLFFGLTLTCH